MHVLDQSAAIQPSRPRAGRWLGLPYRETENGRVEHAAEPVMLVLALLAVPAVVLEAASSQALRPLVFGLDVVIWTGFALELGFVLRVASDRRRALRAHWLDAVIVAVSVPIGPALLQSGRALRLLRLLRLARLGVFGARAVQAGQRVLQPGSLRYLAAFVGLVVVIAGSAIAAVDRTEIHSLWDGIWWAMVTVTTVGYGDISPSNTAGRIIGIVVMLVGVSFFAMLTASIAATFVKSDSKRDEGQILSEILDRLTRIEQALGERES